MQWPHETGRTLDVEYIDIEKAKEIISQEEEKERNTKKQTSIDGEWNHNKSVKGTALPVYN